MSSSITPSLREKIIAFHGHNCPGLTIGIRAAELAMIKLDQPPETDLTAVSETDMCGVDAIQYLTGCTLGKGNLIMKDYGKLAFTFHKISTGRGIRILLRPEAQGDFVDKIGPLMKRVSDGQASQDEKKEYHRLREQLIERYYDLPLDEMFVVQEIASAPPKPPKVLTSLDCEHCGEKVMESRTRRFDGQTLCIPCFGAVEQKV